MDRIAYRRIQGGDWDKRTNAVIYTAFSATEINATEAELSIFLASKASPRYVLQQHIDTLLAKLDDPTFDENKKRRIRKRRDEEKLTVDQSREFWSSLPPRILFPVDAPNRRSTGALSSSVCYPLRSCCISVCTSVALPWTIMS